VTEAAREIKVKVPVVVVWKGPMWGGPEDLNESGLDFIVGLGMQDAARRC